MAAAFHFLMSIPETPLILKYDNLRASPKGLTEVESNRIVLFLPTSEIEKIQLKFGYTSHRPLLTMAFGIITVPLGLYGLSEIFTHPAGFRYEVAMLSVGVIGGSLIFDTLKKRYFLEVHHGRTNSRLIFSRKATRQGVLDFCSQVEEKLKHKVAPNYIVP